MADFNAYVIDIEMLYGTADPVPATELLSSGSASVHLMRGWRPGTSNYEYWQAVGTPNTTNPSGLPISDITVRAKWSLG